MGSSASLRARAVQAAISPLLRNTSCCSSGSWEIGPPVTISVCARSLNVTVGSMKAMSLVASMVVTSSRTAFATSCSAAVPATVLALHSSSPGWVSSPARVKAGSGTPASGSVGTAALRGSAAGSGARVVPPGAADPV